MHEGIEPPPPAFARSSLSIRLMQTRLFPARYADDQSVASFTALYNTCNQLTSFLVDRTRLELVFPGLPQTDPYCLVDRKGIEPFDNCLQNSQEPQLNHSPLFGGVSW